MAGGGGGGYYVGNRSGGDQGGALNNSDSKACSCSLLRVLTPLNSVQADLLKELRMGVVLFVEEKDGRLIALYEGKVIGSLTPLEQSRIIACIADGYTYGAKVTSIDGAACMVEITCRESL